MSRGYVPGKPTGGREIIETPHQMGTGVEAVVSRYLEHLKIRNLRPWTIYNRQRALARLRAWAGGPVLYLTEMQLRDWQANRATESQPEPLRTDMSNLRQFYRWAVGERLLDIDPMARLPIPRVARGLPRPISDDDLLVAIDLAPVDIKAILALAAFAGLRACEIAGLDWSEVGLRDQSPHLRIVEGKGGHGRIIPISSALTAVLEEVPNKRGPVIKRADGKAGQALPHRISGRANTYLHELGIPETLHQCRHRFASVTYQACRDIRAVQDLLGHASPTTTSRYAAVASGVAIDAVETAGALTPQGARP
jgi:integrase/recombinase XerC